MEKRVLESLVNSLGAFAEKRGVVCVNDMVLKRRV
jgi:hypothetical protein